MLAVKKRRIDDSVGTDRDASKHTVHRTSRKKVHKQTKRDNPYANETQNKLKRNKNKPVADGEEGWLCSLIEEASYVRMQPLMKVTIRVEDDQTTVEFSQEQLSAWWRVSIHGNFPAPVWIGSAFNNSPKFSAHVEVLTSKLHLGLPCVVFT